MNILVFTEYFPSSEDADITGGVESRAFHLLHELAKRHTVTVICSYQGKPQHRLDRVAGITVIRVGMKSPYANVGNIIPRLTFAALAFATGLFIPKVQVIDGYNYLNYPIASLVGLIRHKPTVATYHESWSFREWLKLKGWLTGILGWIWTTVTRQLPFTRFIAVSAATKGRLVEQGIKARKIDVVHNGVDVSYFKAVTARPLREPSISVTARLIRSKRVDVLVKALAHVKKRLPNVQLTINGEGEERAALERLVATLKLQRNVTFRGRLRKFEDVLKLRKRHQVFCLPSEVEGFGMVVVEALALGVPVVCTDIPVLREVTGNGKGSLLFKRGDAKDLAEKLLTLLTDKKLHAQKQKEALTHAKQFDWKLLAKQAESVYRGVLR